jgi:hypothetical protein
MKANNNTKEERDLLLEALQGTDDSLSFAVSGIKKETVKDGSLFRDSLLESLRVLR